MKLKIYLLICFVLLTIHCQKKNTDSSKGYSDSLKDIDKHVINSYDTDKKGKTNKDSNSEYETSLKDKDKQFIDKFDNKTKKHDKNSDYETSLKDKDQQVINSYSDKGKKAPRDSNEEYETSLRDKEHIIKSIIEKHKKKNAESTESIKDE